MKWMVWIFAVLMLVLDTLAGVIPVRVTGTRVNLRAKPGLNYEVVAQADQDDVLLAKTFQTDWVEVLPPAGTKAYVYAPMIRDNLVDVEELNVRSGPGVNYTSLGRLQRNMLVVVLGRHGDEWLEIDASADCSMWISADFVEPVKPLSRRLNPVDESVDDELPAPVLAGPSPEAAPAVSTAPEPEDFRGNLLPGSVHLVPLEGQGRPGECSGELRKTPLLDRRSFRFRLVQVQGDSVKTRGYLYGNEPQLNRLVGRTMTVRGPEFWVREYQESVLIPEEIVLQEPAE